MSVSLLADWVLGLWMQAKGKGKCEKATGRRWLVLAVR